MSFFGGSSTDREPREIGNLYERIGRKHMSETASNAGHALIEEVAGLRKEVAALRTMAATLQIAIYDLQKPKKKR